MNMRKKLLGIVGAFALTMSMGAGIAAAQETLPVTTSGSNTVTLLVECGAGNADTGSVTLGASGDTQTVAFESFDPSNPGTVSTNEKAFQVNIDLGECPGTDWSVTASIDDFTSENNDVIAGTHFQLPIGEPLSSAAWTTDGTAPAANVNAPTGTVMFTSDGTTNVSNQALASPSGEASGAMSMQFTGQMVGLDESVEDGNYEAEFTVTFNPSTP